MVGERVEAEDAGEDGPERQGGRKEAVERALAHKEKAVEEG